MSRTKIAMLTQIPDDLRAGLAVDFELVPLEDVRAGRLSSTGIQIAVTTSSVGATADMLKSLPDLTLLAAQGAALDRIDFTETTRRNIAVVHSPDAVTEDTAEFAIALALAATRRLVEGDRFVRAGRWTGATVRPGNSRRFAGRRLGIVGLGKIGHAVARRATALGLEVAYNGRNRKPDVAYTYYESIAELAETSDILVLACPLTPQTRNLITRDILRALGPQGVLVNIARGAVVVEEDLLAALKAREIMAAGLDVFINEPAVDPRYFDLDNVIIEPHFASITDETRAELVATLKDGIVDFLAGQRPRYLAKAP